MKRYIAAALSAVLMFSSAGCSKLEQEHFEKSLNIDKKGIEIINADLTYTIDPEVLFDASVDIAKKLDSEDELEIEDEDFDSSDFIGEMRFLLDENKKCEITLSMSGITDYDKGWSDMAVFAGLNGITLNCGKVYSRGNTAYYDKRFAYTMGAFTALVEDGDISDLNDRLEELDELFGDKKFLRASLDTQKNADLPSTLASELSRKYYNSAKDLLKGFDSGCVSKIKNGTRFELTSKEFTLLSKNFASYLKKNKAATADLVNEYLTDSFALNAAFAGNEAAYLADIAQMFKITPAQIAETADSYNELLATPEYKAFMDTFDISIVNDITEESGIQTSEADYTAKANDKSAVDMKAVQTSEKAKKAEFTKIDTESCIDYADFMEALSQSRDFDYYDDEYKTFDPEEFDENADIENFGEYKDSDFFNNASFEA